MKEVTTKMVLSGVLHRDGYFTEFTLVDNSDFKNPRTVNLNNELDELVGQFVKLTVEYSE